MSRDTTRRPVTFDTMRKGIAHALDVLSRGASPPGMIDMLHTRHSHLRRRFTMIARYDGTSGRWSAAGLALSLLIGGVALTGGVRGQDASPPAAPAAATAADKPAPEAHTPGYPGATNSDKPKVDPAVAEKLWADKFAKEIVLVNGRELNREAVDQAFLAELSRLAGEKGTTDVTAVPRLDPAAAASLWNSNYRDKLYYVNGKPANRQQIEEQFVAELAEKTGSRPAAEATLAGLLPWRAAAGDADAIQEWWERDYRPRLKRVDGKAINQEEVEAQFKKDLRRLEVHAGTAGGRGRADLGAAPQPNPGTPQAPLDEDVDAGLLAQLDRKVPELNFDGAPLSDVVDFLRDLSGQNVVVEWGPLGAGGIDRNAQVSLRAKNIKFSRALDLVLSSAGGGTVPIGYSVDGNIIRVSTLEHLDSMTDVRAYDVRDVLAKEAQMTDLVKLITSTVAPDSWRDAGGSVGVILPTRNKLIVTQTPMNHRQIRSVLQMLREDPHDPAQPTGAAPAAAQAQPSPTAGRQ